MLDAQDCRFLDFAERSDLTGRIRGLVIMLGDHLTLDQARSTDQLIDQSEFGGALMQLADWLGESRTPIPDSIRDDFQRLSSRIGNQQQVMPSLDRCPADREHDD